MGIAYSDFPSDGLTSTMPCSRKCSRVVVIAVAGDDLLGLVGKQVFQIGTGCRFVAVRCDVGIDPGDRRLGQNADGGDGLAPPLGKNVGIMAFGSDVDLFPPVRSQPTRV